MPERVRCAGSVRQRRRTRRRWLRANPSQGWLLATWRQPLPGDLALLRPRISGSRVRFSVLCGRAPRAFVVGQRIPIRKPRSERFGDGRPLRRRLATEANAIIIARSQGAKATTRHPGIGHPVLETWVTKITSNFPGAPYTTTHPGFASLGLGPTHSVGTHGLHLLEMRYPDSL